MFTTTEGAGEEAAEGGDDDGDGHKNTPGAAPNFNTMMKKKKKKKDGAAATPSLKDCANCGAPEGKVYGVTVHRPCSKCGITYYCSVICQKHHWKEGGHKKHCVAKEERSLERSVSAAASAAAEEAVCASASRRVRRGECEARLPAWRGTVGQSSVAA